MSSIFENTYAGQTFHSAEAAAHASLYDWLTACGNNSAAEAAEWASGKTWAEALAADADLATWIMEGEEEDRRDEVMEVYEGVWPKVVAEVTNDAD